MKAAVVTALFSMPQLALAQPANTVFSWQFSIDDGTTWVPNAVVIGAASPAAVRVRALLSWQSAPPTPDIFAAIQFDPFVARMPGFGDGDWIVDPVFRLDNRLQPYPNSAVIALPNLLKVDRTTDVLPPGMGPGWIVASQSISLGEFDSSNPLVIADYTYSLDGTPGTRTVSAALWQNGAGASVGFIDLDVGSNLVLVPASSQPGTITVLPAPTPLALAALAASLTTTRRRRR